MSAFEEGIDPELRAEFIDEALGGLQQIAALLVELEANPDNGPAVQAIFRPIHSIKGNSAYFGLLQTKALAHEMETILDLVRKAALAPDTAVVGVLLRGVDALSAMLGRFRGGQPETPDPEAFAHLLEEVRHLASSEKTGEESLWRGLFEQLRPAAAPGLVAQVERLARMTPAGRKALEGVPATQMPTGHWPAPARRLAEILSNLAVRPDATEVRGLLGDCRALASGPHAAALSAKAQSDFDVLVRTVGLGDPVSRSLLPKHLAALFPAPVEPKAEKSKESAPAPPAPAPGAVSTGPAESKTMRVPEARIDAFLAHVGDLVTIGEMYGHLCHNLTDGEDGKNAARELRRINEDFGQLSLALQHSIMQIRKLPVHGMLSRVPRLVRDIADARGKQIETRVSGDDILVDKSLIDALDAPLMHMVRNAADHGIEMPEERLAAGKAERGRITVSVVETPDDILLAITDDGKGLDRRALTEKAVKLELISPTAVLSDADIVQLLFMSGVSTAKEVTDVSGRGVGMDVVKRAVEEVGGRIDVASQPGQGTQMTVRLPKTVTTQILDGFIVLVAGGRYVFPLKSVQRCFRPGPADLVPVRGQGLCVKAGTGLLRVLSLAKHLGFCSGPVDSGTLQEGILVVVEGAARTLAVHVDGIDGVRRVVLKNLAGWVQGEGAFAGGAIMGDGTVALILDVEALIEKDARLAGPIRQRI